jgi:hypothetical protein
MALSNRDRIGRTFELLAPPLDEFIARSVASHLPPGTTWPALVAMKDKRKGPGKEYDPLDPQVQLRMLTENVPDSFKPGWHPFSDAIGHVGEGYAKELRAYRNDWAHNKSFSDDDAYRCLDTAERLLTAIAAPEVADELRAIRLDLRRRTADKDDRKALKSAVLTPESAGLRPWREVLQPHEDVATGNFQAAEFAADLHKVAATDDAEQDYAEPVRFFARTYLTEGLRDLIDQAVRRLAGDQNASPVINLQTNFGGGKTHSMLALWHLASGTPRGEYPQDLQELLGDVRFDELTTVRRVALVGNHISPSGSVKGDGTQVNTIWGELAWQLGGREGFAKVATADANRTPPGEALHELLAAYAPAVVLIDEWVAYARSLFARDDLAGGTFDDQFTRSRSPRPSRGRPGCCSRSRSPHRRAATTPTRPSATPRRSAARTGSRRSSACRTSCGASRTSGGPRPRTRRTTSCASACSSRPTRRRSRRSTRPHAPSSRCTTGTPTTSPARRARAVTRTASSRPIRSIRSCSSVSTRTGRASSASSGRAACCG